MVVVGFHGYLFCLYENSRQTHCYLNVNESPIFGLFIKKLIKFP
jgi:hypothetical protein